MHFHFPSIVIYIYSQMTTVLHIILQKQWMWYVIKFVVSIERRSRRKSENVVVWYSAGVFSPQSNSAIIL